MTERVRHKKPGLVGAMQAQRKQKRGVYGKYVIEKADGSPVDPDACYFVLRLDTDPAARRAMGQYARSVRSTNEELADQIEDCIQECERPSRDCGCRGAMCPHSSLSDMSYVWRHGGSDA